MARASLSPPLEFQKSMPLLRTALRDLADLHRLPLPGVLWDCVKTLQQAGSPEPGGRRELVKWLVELSQRLRRAHKFSLGSDFAALVAAAAKQSPTRIERMLPTARMPFSEVWIEWPHQAGSSGFLISTVDRALAEERATDSYWLPGCEVYRLWPLHFTPGTPENRALLDKDEVRRFLHDIGGRQSFGLVVLPHCALEFSFDGEHCDEKSSYRRGAIEISDERAQSAPAREREATRRLDRRQCMRDTPLGQYAVNLLDLAEDYPRGREAADRLGRHIELGLHVDTVLQDLMTKPTALLALMSTHIGSTPLVRESPVQKSGQYLAKGRVRPGFEYRVLTLYRPVEPPKLFRRAFPQRKAEGVPLHEVSGAWHHRRAPAAHCQQYPGSCPLAEWEPVVDEEEKPVGAEQQRCQLCARKRWFIAGHPRGDRQFGVIEKSYQVRASKGSRAGAPT